MDSTILSSTFCISIPEHICDRQKWSTGQKFIFIIKGKAALLMPVPTLEELQGIAEGASTEDYRDRYDRF